jgi:transcriptional regulator with XRE-family HTH domain
MPYAPAVSKRRRSLLAGKPIRQIARDVGIADSQLVRLLNGHSRRPSYKLIRNVAAALGYRSSDRLYDELEGLWKSMDRAEAS